MGDTKVMGFWFKGPHYKFPTSVGDTTFHKILKLTQNANEVLGMLQSFLLQLLTYYTK